MRPAPCAIRLSRQIAPAASGLGWKTTYASDFSFDVVMATPCSKFEGSLGAPAPARLVPGRTKSWIARCQDLGRPAKIMGDTRKKQAAAPQRLGGATQNGQSFLRFTR